MMRRLKLVWLLVNDPSVVSNVHRYMWHGTFDEENPKVKIWLDKLPAVTFAVRVRPQDLEEGARLLSVREAHRRAWLEEGGISVELG